MNMSPLKEAAIKMVESLPDDCTVEDIEHQLYVLSKILKGRKAAEEGQVVSHQEVHRRFSEWQESTGLTPQ
jgi:predicted transcriptional regulator